MDRIGDAWTQFVHWVWDMEDHSITWWTFIFTAVGVIAGLIVLYLTWKAVRDTRIQTEKNTETTKAEFLLQLRQAFASHVEAHINLRPEGIWHANKHEPSSVSDYAKIELYMGLFEYCDELLEKGFLDEASFSRQYLYRINNLLTNNFVINNKLIAARAGWLGFINLCYRLKAKIPCEVKRLSPQEVAEVYPARRKKGFSLIAP